MKKLLAYILVLVFILALVGCNDTQNNQNETSLSTTSQTANDTTTPNNTPEGGSTEGGTSMEDQPNNQPKELLAIVDLTETQDIPTDDALEYFYSDTYYYYIFGSIKSEYVMVYYKDGTEENVKVALEEGHISIEDLIKFNIYYTIEMKKDLPQLTMSTLKKLVATYGEALTWSHFDPHYYGVTGSGLYIRYYEIDENYRLMIGGPSTSVAPYYIYFSERGNPNGYIDVRYESIDEYIGNCQTGVHKWDNGTWNEAPDGGEELIYHCRLCEATQSSEPNLFRVEASFENFHGGRENAYYTHALNAHEPKMWIPLLKFDTLEEVEEFKPLLEGDALRDFNQVTEPFDEAFFAENTLMLFCFESSSGTYRYGVNSVFCDGSEFCVNVEQLNNPDIYTEDMAFWIAVFPIADSMIENCNTFNAVMLPDPRE